jgi:hypothetical protein
MPKTIEIVMKVSVARVSVRKRRPLAPSKKRRDARKAKKMGGGENP